MAYLIVVKLSPTLVKAGVGKRHDQCEINKTQEWISHQWFVLKRLFYAEQNEYQRHTLDKHFTACVADAAYCGLLISLQLRLVLPREKS